MHQIRYKTGPKKFTNGPKLAKTRLKRVKSSIFGLGRTHFCGIEGYPSPPFAEIYTAEKYVANIGGISSPFCGKNPQVVFETFNNSAFLATKSFLWQTVSGKK